MSITTSFYPVPPFFSVAEDEYDEKCVSVMLEGEETEMVFIDHPHSEISVSRIWGILAPFFEAESDFSGRDHGGQGQERPRPCGAGRGLSWPRPP